MESLEHRCCPRICAGYHPPSHKVRHPPAPQNHPRDTSRGAWWCGGHSGAVMFGHTLPCHCEGVRPTLKTLAYDCGNPVQCVCGRYARSTFLFTGSPRFARDDNGDEVRVLECSTPPPVAQSATPPAKGGGHSDISLYAHPLPLVIPAPGVPANTNVFVGWIRRE